MPRTDDTLLRDIQLVPYNDGRKWRLRLWDAQRAHRPGASQAGIEYEFTAPDGSIIFSGDDYGCSPMNAIDSDACVRGLLGFLTLRLGDTDADYFDNYTDVQRGFAATDAEALSMWALDPSDDPSDGPAMVFEEWEPSHCQSTIACEPEIQCTCECAHCQQWRDL